MIPQLINAESDVQVTSTRWLLDAKVVCRLKIMASRLGFPISIISGWRSCEEQKQLAEAGRPTATCALSTHVASCPATGVDLWPGVVPVVSVRARMGAEGVFAGLRWGGGGPVDQDGQPLDWNHFDLGPVAG